MARFPLSRRAFTRLTVLGTLAGLRRARAATPVAFESDPAVFWSWTTADQRRELEAGAPLFNRSESPGQGPGFLFRHLATQASPAATLLRSPRFEKGRFGWINPWATCLGFGGESYGDELLRIRLKPGALFAQVDTADIEVRFTDAGNLAVPAGTAMSTPETIAGIVFVNRTRLYRDTFGRCRADTEGNPYREVYLANEGMVESWSVGSAEIRGVLQRAVAQLGHLQESLREAKVPECWAEQVIGELWNAKPAAVTDPVEAYQRGLAFLDAAYYPSPANLARIRAALSLTLSRLPQR